MSNKITGLLRRGTAFAVTGLMMVGSSGLSWVDLTAEAATAPPEYVVTVYWNVVNDNNNRANYIRLNYKYPKVTASGNEVLTNAKTGYEFIDKVAETSGSNVQSFTVQGIPDSLDLSVWGKTADKSEFYVERVTIKAADPVAYCGINTITLWEGKFGCKISTINGATNGNTLHFGKTSAYFDSWKDTGVGSNRTTDTTFYYEKNGEGVSPFGISSLVCDGDIYAPTDNKAANYTLSGGVVYDLYGAKYPDQQKVFSFSGAPAGSLRFNENTSFSVMPFANQANDYTCDISAAVYSNRSISTKKRTVRVHTFDYNVTFKGADGTVLKTQTVDYNKSTTPPEPPKYYYKNGKCCKFSGWSGDSYKYIINGPQDRTVTAQYNTEAGTLGGSGTSYVPYRIYTADDWDKFKAFCDADATDGVYFRLMNDITVSTMAGSREHPFKGDFDGAGHTITADISGSAGKEAVFSCIDGATIKNLTVGGSITGGQHCAALAGFADGKNTIENINVTADVNLNSSVSAGDAHHGGVIGHALDSETALRGVVYSGTIGSKAYYSDFVNVGGIIGWADNANITMNDCLFAGEYSGGSKFHPIGCKYDAASASIKCANVYYTAQPTSVEKHTLADTSKPAHTITAGEYVTVGGGNATQYNVSGITAYGTGLAYNGKYYAAKDETVTLGNTLPAGHDLTGYTASAGTIDGDTLTMPDSDVTVNVEYELGAIDISLAAVSFERRHIVYTGEEITPKFTVKFGDTVLTEGIDYTVSGETSAVDAGEHTITITGIGGYKNTVSAVWVIDAVSAYVPPVITYVKGDGAVRLDWTAVRGAESYAVMAYLNGEWTKIAECDSNTYTITGLTPGKEYKVAVITKLDGEWFTDTSNAIIVTPNAPVYPQVNVEVRGNAFRLSWDAVPGADKYAVAYYSAGKWRLLDQFDATRTVYTRTKVPAGTYQLAVGARVDGKWDISNLNQRAVTVTIK